MWGARHRGLGVHALPRLREVGPVGVYHRCAVSGCEGLAWPGDENCKKCGEEIEALAAMDAQGAAYAPDAAKAASRLENFCYACGAIGVVLYLTWETRSFWIDRFQIVVNFFAWLFSGSGGAQ